MPLQGIFCRHNGTRKELKSVPSEPSRDKYHASACYY